MLLWTGSAAAVGSSGTVLAWGYNSAGQLGDGSTRSSSTPLLVKGIGGRGALSGVVATAAGADFSLALLSNGTVVSWGDNNNGQLGDGASVSSPTPVQVEGIDGGRVLSGVVAIAAGTDFSLALLSNGTVASWGNNQSGQLGDNSVTDSDHPVQVVNESGVGPLTGVTAISAGAYHSLALLSSGASVAWGDNSNGQLGNGNFNASSTPVNVGGAIPIGVTAVAAGAYHSLELVGGGVLAWGYNGYGQLGNNSSADSDMPVVVHGIGGAGALSGVSAIAAGGYHNLALVGGAVAAWGNDDLGQTGTSSPQVFDVPVPELAIGLGGEIGIAAGGDQSFALHSGGVVQAWGYNADGELGNGGTKQEDIGVSVLGFGGSGTLDGALALAQGPTAYHELATQPVVAHSSPGALTFAAHVGSSSPGQAATLTNAGPGPLVVSGVSLAGPFTEGADSCTGVILPGASCAISFLFRPTTAGVAHATAAIQSNASSGPLTLSLSGNGVLAATPLPPPPTPQLSPLRLSSTSFKAASSGPATMPANARRKTGALIIYTDSEAATTTFVIQRCVASAKHSPRKTGVCTRYRTVGGFTHGDIAGLNRLRFTGRINNHKLSAGRYRLQATASLNTKTSAARAATFTIKQ
jgi:alpha-tubulin suppressor-like RCC1 family protein